MSVQWNAGAAAPFLLCATSVCAIGTAAAADEAEGDVGAYGKVSVGAAFTSDLDHDLAYDGLAFIGSPPTGQSVASRTGVSFGAGLGFKYPSGFRTEFEYRYSRNDASSFSFSGGDVFPTEPVEPNASVVAHFLMSSVLYDFDNATRVTPYVGVGVGGARVRNVVNGGASTATDMAFAWQAKAGLSYDLSPALKLSAEYIYSRTGDLEFQTDLGAGATLTTSGGAFSQSSVMIALVKAF